MKKLLLILMAMMTLTANAGGLGTSLNFGNGDHVSKKISKSATTITPNPLKPNRIYKTKKADTHKTAGEPVASLNSPAPILGCQEKVVQPCKKWYNMKIVEAYIGPMPMHLFDPMPSVTVMYENGIEEKLFDFYPDEISFKKEELIGLTKEQVLKLRHEKDVSFLRS